MSILQVEGLVKSFGRRRVVDGVDFHVDKGEIVGLLGPNGAGKTTCFRMTCGMIEPDRGRVLLGEQDVTTWPMFQRARDGGMGYLAQESSVFRKLSVQQNLTGMMEMLGISRRERKQRCEELLEKFKITHIRRSKAASLSGGERRRLEIARCLVSDPQIILLDEPFTGIDPVTIDGIQEIIRQLRTNGISILITDHQVRETLEITDRSYVIRSGQVLCHGTPGEVTSNPDARKYYFGDSIQLKNSVEKTPQRPPTSKSPAAQSTATKVVPKAHIASPQQTAVAAADSLDNDNDSDIDKGDRSEAPEGSAGSGMPAPKRKKRQRLRVVR